MVAYVKRSKILKFMVVAIILLIAGMVVSCGSRNNSAGRYGAETEEILDKLDSVIPRRADYIAEKERRLDSLKMQFPADDKSRYHLYDRLYWEYYSYDPDSASVYAKRKLDVADRSSDRRHQSVSRLNLARILLARGHTHEAVTEMQKALTDTADPSVKAMWLDFMITKETMAGRNPVKWQERFSLETDPTAPEWIYNQSNLLRQKGKLRESAEILESNRDKLSITRHNEAITDYLIGKRCLLLGDTLSAIRNIAASAVNDLITPVRDYKSLYELASLLLATGDVARAYRYINLAVEDANSTRIFDNMVAVNGIMPQIVTAYDKQLQRERRVQIWYASGISLLALLLVAALVLTIRSRNAAGKAARREKELNGKLREINKRLEELNKGITESNKVKDAYLVQYFNLCSYFVGRLEEFRGSVSVASRTKGLAGVEKLLVAYDDDRELKKFYSNFDSTFLTLFPGFIEQLNSLLRTDCHVSLNRDGSMSNELRTIALIRLGVNDSEQIARFLRRSVSTIYNYRVKMRNAAIGPRDEFEKNIMEISS